MQRLPRYKGKVMTEKQYKRRLSQIQSGNRRKKKIQCDEIDKSECIVEGRRIVELKVMAQHLYCSFCKEILSLDDTEREVRKGLASLLTVRCSKCLATTVVPTSKVHKGVSGLYEKYDTNSKAVLGAIHSGLGYTSINKFLSVMNLPNMSNKTFKNYEREIGPVVESVAKDSCIEACDEERQLTISQLEDLKKRL
ncbi:uncharacterized protein [Prorops nasuta]|uniref:uncharacterized protein n=1 Tax=Prorops nasuta TaxID=863751 RepID=UPI0034CF3E92